MKTRAAHVVCTVVAALAAVTLPATASGDHSTAIAPFGSSGSTVTPAGCQAKGVWAIPAPKSSGVGLAPATYLYTVSAVLASGETPACAPITVTTTVGSDSVVLQWNAVPGALGYRVYRNDGTASTATLRALIISAGNTVLPPQAFAGGPPCPSVGRADKCIFQDNGGPQDAAQMPTLIGTTSQAGTHADVNVVQTINYGSDTYDVGGTSTTASLRSNLLHAPPGFIANPKAAPTCKLQGAAPSLIGDPVKFGSDDADEDTCSNAALIGTVQSRALTPSGQTLTEGDIYNGETKNGEPGRLFVVLRPPCSAGNLVASPGSTSCNTQLGGANREVEKTFLASVARIVDRGGGVYALDVDTVDAETDGPISAAQNVLVPSPSLQRLGKIHISVLQLTQHLFGVADQATSTASDDKPFTTLPTSCAAKTFSVDAATYTHPTPANGAAATVLSGCAAVPFDPSATATLDTLDVLAPVGFGVGTTLGADVAGIHQSHVKKLTATLPPGLALSASSGNAVTSVPTTVGSVSGTSDELGDLTGTLTLESVGSDPGGHFDGSVGLRAEVTDTKPNTLTRLILHGTATADPATGQLTATFDDLPEVPFKSLSLNFTGGAGSALVNPPDCGAHTVAQALTPWSGEPAENASTTFTATDTAGCPSPRPFQPTLAVSAEPTTAGAFTKFTATITRPDKHQALAGFALDLPPGMLAKLGEVPICGDSSAVSGSCPEETRIGSVDIVTGTGPSPVTLTGGIYLAVPVPGTGDIASLAIAVPAKVGPFDAGTSVSRARLAVHFSEGNINVTTTGTLPAILTGIPVRISSLRLTIDRANFQRNPTSCAAKAASATFTSQGDPTTAATAAEGGASATASAPYQATGCDALSFSPSVTGTVGGTGRTAEGKSPDLSLTIGQPPGDASMKSVKVTLPDALGASAEKLATPCEEAQLVTDTCPAGLVGSATASTPLLPGTLSGPVYLVSQGGSAPPKLSVLLRGVISLRLDGQLGLSGGTRITNLFADLPDVPLTSFTLSITNGLLRNSRDLCSGPNALDSEFTAHNGKIATTLAAPLQVVGGCAATTNPKATVTLRELKSGRPTMKASVRRTGTAAIDLIKKVRLTLPKGLKAVKRAARKRLKVTVGGKRVARKRIKVTERRITVSLAKGVSNVKFDFRKPSLRSSGALKRNGRKARPKVKFRVTNAVNGVKSITVKVKPKS